MYSRFLKLSCLGLALAGAALMPMPSAAQDSAKPAAKASSFDSPSRWDIFAGYSYLAPKGKQIAGDYPRSITDGVIGSVTRYFNNNVGVQVEGDHHWSDEKKPNNDFHGGSAGLIFRFPTEDITPFVHALVGGENVGSYYYKNQWGVVLTAGGGVDYNTPFFDHRLARRGFQGDYHYRHAN